MLNMDHKIKGLRGADYNPRYISEEDLASLRRSVTELGLIKPIIVRKDLIVAGHQRTKALRALGMKTAPVYSLPQDTTAYDEIRFNQMHNGTDLDMGGENCTIPAGLEPGWHQVKPNQIKGDMRCRGAGVREDICNMILRYGPWGGVVATTKGEVFHCAQYALSSKISRRDLTVYVIHPDKEEKAREYLGQIYGVFNYDKLSRDTYMQTYAQPFRLRKTSSSVGAAGGSPSVLYERYVIPWLKKNRRAAVLDFGAGQGDYVRRLASERYAIDELEFFRRKKGKDAIDRGAVESMIDRLVSKLERGHRFDAVVCDSVINSVDSMDAHEAVIRSLLLFSAPDAMIFMCGRSMAAVRSRMDACKYGASTTDTRTKFLDHNNFTAQFQKGKWFYQKFHSLEQVDDIIERYGLRVIKRSAPSSQYWHLQFQKTRELTEEEIRQAVNFEFTMPLPGNKRYERNNDVLRALGLE